VNGDRLPSVEEDQNIVYSTVQHVAEVGYSLIDLDPSSNSICSVQDSVSLSDP